MTNNDIITLDMIDLDAPLDDTDEFLDLAYNTFNLIPDAIDAFYDDFHAVPLDYLAVSTTFLTANNLTDENAASLATYDRFDDLTITPRMILESINSAINDQISNARTASETISARLA